MKTVLDLNWTSKYRTSLLSREWSASYSSESNPFLYFRAEEPWVIAHSDICTTLFHFLVLCHLSCKASEIESAKIQMLTMLGWTRGEHCNDDSLPDLVAPGITNLGRDGGFNDKASSLICSVQ